MLYWKKLQHRQTRALEETIQLTDKNTGRNYTTDIE